MKFEFKELFRQANSKMSNGAESELFIDVLLHEDENITARVFQVLRSIHLNIELALSGTSDEKLNYPSKKIKTEISTLKKGRGIIEKYGRIALDLGDGLPIEAQKANLTLSLLDEYINALTKVTQSSRSSSKLNSFPPLSHAYRQYLYADRRLVNSLIQDQIKNNFTKLPEIDKVDFENFAKYFFEPYTHGK